MTPSDRASEIISHWPSKNFVHDAARPSIKMQITKAIEQDRAERGLAIINAIDADTKLGVHSKELVVSIVMEVLGIDEAELV